MYHSRLCIGVSGTASPPPGKFNVATPPKISGSKLSRYNSFKLYSPLVIAFVDSHVETLQCNTFECFVELSPCFTLRPTDITNI